MCGPVLLGIRVASSSARSGVLASHGAKCDHGPMYVPPYEPPRPLSAVPNGVGALSQYDVSPAHAVLAAIYLAATAAGAYHGYQRNDSVGWAIVWGLSAGLFPYFALPIAAAQGYGEPRKAI